MRCKAVANHTKELGLEYAEEKRRVTSLRNQIGAKDVLRLHLHWLSDELCKILNHHLLFPEQILSLLFVLTVLAVVCEKKKTR